MYLLFTYVSFIISLYLHTLIFYSYFYRHPSVMKLIPGGFYVDLGSAWLWNLSAEMPFGNQSLSGHKERKLELGPGAPRLASCETTEMRPRCGPCTLPDLQGPVPPPTGQGQ